MKENDLLMRISKNIKFEVEQYMYRHRITKAEMSRRCNLNDSAIKWLTNSNKDGRVPRLDTLHKISKVLNIPTDELILVKEKERLTLGEYIENFMKETKTDIHELSNNSGLSPEYLNDIIKDKRELSLKYFKDLCIALNVSPNELLDLKYK